MEVNNKGALSNSVSLISKFTQTSSKSLCINNLLNIIKSTESFQECNSISSLFIWFKSIFNNKGNGGNLSNSVTASKNKGNNTSSSNSWSSSMSLLLKIDLSVPPSPNLNWSKHSTLTTHVTKSSLTTSVSTTSWNSRDTSNSSTSTPRLCTVAHTSIDIHSVSLSSVLSDIRMDKVNDIGTNGGLENSRKRDMFFKDFVCIISVEHRDQRNGSHFW